MKIKYNSEIISGLVFVIVAAVLWLLIPSQTIPRIAIGGLFLCSAGLLIQGLLSHDKKEIVITRESFHADGFRREMRSLLFAAFLIIYCFLVTLLGFIVSTVLLVIAILLFYGARKWYYYAIPLVMIGVVYYVFAVLLRISLP